MFPIKQLAKQAYLRERRRQQGMNEKAASREGSDQKKQREKMTHSNKHTSNLYVLIFHLETQV